MTSESWENDVVIYVIYMLYICYVYVIYMLYICYIYIYVIITDIIYIYIYIYMLY